MYDARVCYIVGGSPPSENPAGVGTLEFPLRFPGQDADKETNTHCRAGPPMSWVGSTIGLDAYTNIRIVGA